MIFSRKNAGKWVASKNEKIIASGRSLQTVMKKVETRKDKGEVRYDLVPPHQHFAGARGISLR